MSLRQLNGYAFVPGHSTAGIIYNDGGEPNFRELIEPADTFRVPEDVDVVDATPLIACSSSRGLVVFRHAATNVYSIGNPFIDPLSPDAYKVLPPPPRFHNVASTHVVLANRFISPERTPHPVFDLICAVCVAPGKYVFDTYTSLNGFWIFTDVIDADGRDILPTTGVSCGRFAYWLTRFPYRSVLRFDDMARYEHGMKTATFWPLAQPQYPFLDHPKTRLQLGRLLEDELVLVAVVGATDAHGPRVELFIVRQDDGVLNPYAVLRLTIQDDVKGNNVLIREFLGALECRDLPRPIRSESFKMEVLLWVDDRLVLWENNTEEPEMRHALLLPYNADIHVVSGFAHIFTTTLPGIFQRLVDEDDDDQDPDEDNEEESDEDADNHENEDQHDEGSSGASCTVTFQDPNEDRI